MVSEDELSRQELLPIRRSTTVKVAYTTHAKYLGIYLGRYVPAPSAHRIRQRPTASASNSPTGGVAAN